MQIGQNKFKESYFQSLSGVNTADSPFVVQPSNAGDGFNYDYDLRGGFRKRLGHRQINAAADTELRSRGIGFWEDPQNNTAIIRSAGSRMQNFAYDATTFTNLSKDDSAASTDPFLANSEVPVDSEMFTNGQASVLWMAGGGASEIVGAYSETKFTCNGADVATGTMGATPSVGAGTLSNSTTYAYAVALYKPSTGVTSNVALDVVATMGGSDNTVTLDLSSITVSDTTTYTEFWIYRSGAGGASGFTTGELIVKVSSTATSYVDLGTNLATSQNIPRAGNTLLDQSKLPAGDYKFTTKFKNRLVTSSGSTVYISDLNKSESWPLVNILNVPSGGPVTGLGVISFNTPTTSELDEILVVFKEDEVWTITGTGLISGGLPDWTLKFIDNVGCPVNASVVNANGYVMWLNRRGFFMWDGSGKPIYISRPIEDYFSIDGDFDGSKIDLVWGRFFGKDQKVIWYVSHKEFGEQKWAFKLDLRLTIPQVSSDLGGRVIDGIWAFDKQEASLYSGQALLPVGQSEQRFVAGDASGFMYDLYSRNSDSGLGIDFKYVTPFLDQGSPGVTKNYQEVVLWVVDYGKIDVTLNYWTDYRVSEEAGSKQIVTISEETGGGVALWDVALMDVAVFGDAEFQFKKIRFKLNGQENNNRGDCIRLSFEQNGADQPVVAAGYEIIYSQGPVDQ